MELVAVVLMVVAGGVIAAFVMIAVAIARRELDAAPGTQIPSRERDAIAASLLAHLVEAGGASPDEALRAVRRGAGIAAPVTRGVDVGNWADRYATLSTPQQRAGLLETAVQLLRSPVPVRQYAALLDLSFGLGFHADALAKLRELYGFEYADHAKEGRPREADRGGGAPLFARQRRGREELLRVLEVSGSPSRQEITAAYRRLAARHHPDRYHSATAEEQSEAAARFIEITRAYEELLLIERD